MYLLSAFMITGVVFAVVGVAVWRLTATPRWIPAVIGSVGGILFALPPVFSSLQPAFVPAAVPQVHATVAPVVPQVPVSPATPRGPGGASADTPIL